MSDLPLEGQIPPAFYDTMVYYDPSIYPRPGATRPPLATLPNYTNPDPSQLFLGAGGHGVSHRVPDYYHQGMMYPAENFQSASFQPMYDPSTGWFVPPNYYRQQQLAQIPPSDTSDWFLHATHFVPQAQMSGQEHFQNVGTGAMQGYGCGSNYGQHFQANVGPYAQNDQSMYQDGVGPYGAQAVFEAQNDPLASPSGSSSSSERSAVQEDAEEEGEHTQMGAADERYQCPQCQQLVLTRRRVHHERTHDPNERYYCLICVVENEKKKEKVSYEFSRMDALKRHIAKMHLSFERFLPARISTKNPKEADPWGLLAARAGVTQEDLVPIREEVERQKSEKTEANAQGKDQLATSTHGV